jgi:hypothetical protein
MKYSTLAAVLPTCVLLALPVKADPMIGFGLTFYFGPSGVQTGVGLRVFSNNEQGSGAFSVGVDYMPGDGSWRGTLGGGWMENDGYVGFDMGIGFGSGDISFGVSTGAANTVPEPSAPPPPPQQPPQQPPQLPPQLPPG